MQQIRVFVHHTPGYNPTFYDPEILDRTGAMIGEAGYAVDNDLRRSHADGLVSVAAECQHSPECAIIPMPETRDPRT
ncbi:hypothetical protein QMK19_21230 [Streptomyces sp. H10-C2]|uniref:hypothetical protein n=1 Tax=unclassified Streptomyces TaxID=2593676 RepID=UPI0024BB21AC|nr:MULTISPECIES: hypothetical protein [unclassified Streptomyces]MDJ0345368.1 hypothetical protein [Streptomyces sp. PH10-H1]MDJ0372123.1 hypothetical protein [Streptomyces sp. H10-C2]